MNGIVVCAREGSSRLPGKALRQVNGIPVIEHLFKRILKSGLLCVLAIPDEDLPKFESVITRLRNDPQFKLFTGHPGDPMLRMYLAAKQHGITKVVRVCHDKIFVEPEIVLSALTVFDFKNLDYLYSSHFTAGSGFEIINIDILEKAVNKYKNVEFVSYAIKSLTKNSFNYTPQPEAQSDYRFLIDYPKDLALLNVILSHEGSDCSLYDAIKFMDDNKWAHKINRLPIISVYTCAHNAEKWIEKCMGSVAEQKRFKEMEYILIDDCSTDKTTQLMARFSTRFHNVRFSRNQQNHGLASSSNIALADARGDYIIRLDADDYLAGGPTILEEMLAEIKEAKKDVLYPHNYYGKKKTIQNGRAHHVGGALFCKSAVNHIKFTEKLRGYEGLDFFLRAREQLNVGYFGKPVFFYRQHSGSMSKTNLKMREDIKRGIENSASGN